MSDTPVTPISDIDISDLTEQLAAHVPDDNVAYWITSKVDADGRHTIDTEDGEGRPACAVCGSVQWPCPPARALAEIERQAQVIAERDATIAELTNEVEAWKGNYLGRWSDPS